eukprot:s2539_g6.t1
MFSLLHVATSHGLPAVPIAEKPNPYVPHIFPAIFAMSQLSADSLASAGDVPPSTDAPKTTAAPPPPAALPEQPEQPPAEAMLTLGRRNGWGRAAVWGQKLVGIW